jgi:hypothetical protein
MRLTSCAHTVKWLELAISPRWQEVGAVATVQAMHRDGGHSCFGITLDQRWLCSSEGALTVFDSLAAAIRFLKLLNVDPRTDGGHCDAPSSDPGQFQCFRLDANGLSVCGKCREHVRRPALATAEDVFQEERW